MPAHRLHTLVAPDSVAVVGASRRTGSVGNDTLRNVLRGKFPGPVYAVNPAYDEVEGVACFDSLQALPEVPEHVIFTVGDRHIEAALASAIGIGVPAATIYSTLHLADDAAPPLVNRIQSMAKNAGMLLAGGNGMGFFNFNHSFWNCGFSTRAHRNAGNVVLLSQSGAGMSGILDCEQRIDFLFAASTGQELNVGIEDYLDYTLDLPATRVIGLFLETCRQPAKMIAALQKALRLRIPVVALKVGRSALAAELALSHSGALAGSDASYQALFDRYGVQRVNDMDELATALIMFAQPFPLPSPRGSDAAAGEGIVTLHDSGGERQLTIDLAQAEGVPFAVLAAQTKQQLAELLDPGLPVVNPLDAWGAGGPDAGAIMAETFAAMLADTAALFGAVIHDRGPDGQIVEDYLDYLEQAHAASDKPVFLVAARQGTSADDRVISSTRRGFPVLDGVRQFLVGARCLLNYRTYLHRPLAEPPALPPTAAAAARKLLVAAGGDGALDEFTSMAVLRAAGLPMNASSLVHTSGELEALAGALCYPVVIKTAEYGIAHKSDGGGVILNVSDADALRRAYQTLSAKFGRRAVVSPMLTGEGVEMLLGMARDVQLGPMLVVGFGGIHAELLHDVRTIMAPCTAETVHRALDGLRLRPLLDGARGRAAVDIDAYCEMAARLASFAITFADSVGEIDINPVWLGPAGAVGLDALLVCDESDSDPALRQDSGSAIQRFDEVVNAQDS